MHQVRSQDQQALQDPLVLLEPHPQSQAQQGQQDQQVHQVQLQDRLALPDLPERLQLLQVQLALLGLQARLQQLQAPPDPQVQRGQVRQSLAQLDQRVPQVRRVP